MYDASVLIFFVYAQNNRKMSLSNVGNNILSKLIQRKLPCEHADVEVDLAFNKLLFRRRQRQLSCFCL